MANEMTGGDALDLSTDINVITAEINAYQRVAGEAIFEIGKRLKHVKETDLVHGEWTKWCESIGMDRASAHKFITIYEEMGDSYVEKFGRTGMTALYQIATMPEELRNLAFNEEGAVKTVRELRDVKRGISEGRTGMTYKEIEEYKRKEVRRRQPKVKRHLIRSGIDECSVCGFDCKAILHLHHIVPVEHGGDNSEGNLSILCPNCHAMIHSFLSDVAEKEYGLDYLIDWMNLNISPEGISVVRELWRQRVGKDVS